jgi:hypothetical protein
MGGRVVRTVTGLLAVFVVGAVIVIRSQQSLAVGAPTEEGPTPIPVRPAPKPPVATPTFMPRPISTPINPPTVTAPDVAAGATWRTHTHPADGYRVSYPPDWYLYAYGRPNGPVWIQNYEEGQPGADYRTRPDFGQMYRIHVSPLLKDPKQTLPDFVAEVLAVPSAGPGPVSQEDLALPGKQAVLERRSFPAAGPAEGVLLAAWIQQAPDRVLSIGAVPEASEAAAVFWRVVNSLEFVK